MQRSEQSSSSRVQINTAKHGVLSTRISMINFGMLNGGPVANVASFGEPLNVTARSSRDG
jgi:hypothetical protein